MKTFHIIQVLVLILFVISLMYSWANYWYGLH